MSVFDGGGEMSAFFPLDGSTTESIATSSFDATKERCSILLGVNGSTTGGIASAALGSQTTLWTRVGHYASLPPFFTTDYTFAGFYNATGTLVAKVTLGTVLYGTTDYYCKFWHLKSGVFEQLGSTFTFSTGAINAIVVKIVAGASPSFELYLSGTLRASGSGTGSSLDNIDVVKFHNPFQPTHVTGILFSTTTLVGFDYKMDYPTGAGALTAWVGAYTDVDELVYSDADGISSAVANDVSTFTYTRSLTGLSVQAILVSARAKRSAGGPQNIKLAVRSAGTTYLSSQLALTDGYAPYTAAWATDPATSAAWATVPEFGVKSIA